MAKKKLTMIKMDLKPSSVNKDISLTSTLPLCLSSSLSPTKRWMRIERGKIMRDTCFPRLMCIQFTVLLHINVRVLRNFGFRSSVCVLSPCIDYDISFISLYPALTPSASWYFFSHFLCVLNVCYRLLVDFRFHYIWQRRSNDTKIHSKKNEKKKIISESDGVFLSSFYASVFSVFSIFFAEFFRCKTVVFFLTPVCSYRYIVTFHRKSVSNKKMQKI